MVTRVLAMDLTWMLDRLRLRIDDWQALAAKQQLFEGTKNEWVFRGQSCAVWPLATSLERVVKEFGLGSSVRYLEGPTYP